MRHECNRWRTIHTYPHPLPNSDLESCWYNILIPTSNIFEHTKVKHIISKYGVPSQTRSTVRNAAHSFVQPPASSSQVAAQLYTTHNTHNTHLAGSRTETTMAGNLSFHLCVDCGPRIISKVTNLMRRTFFESPLVCFIVPNSMVYLVCLHFPYDQYW